MPEKIPTDTYSVAAVQEVERAREERGDGGSNADNDAANDEAWAGVHRALAVAASEHTCSASRSWAAVLQPLEDEKEPTQEIANVAR